MSDHTTGWLTDFKRRVVAVIDGELAAHSAFDYRASESAKYERAALARELAILLTVREDTTTLRLAARWLFDQEKRLDLYFAQRRAEMEAALVPAA